jgi:glycosyltransferase involved in cell wall biosynthesis
VANRFRGVPHVTVVVDRRHASWPVRLMRFIVDGLRARGPFDGVESHVLYTAGFAALIVARLRGLPLLAYSHGTDARQYADWGRGYRFFVRQVVRHADLLATNSEDTAQHLRRIGREPQIIPPGYDDELFLPSPRPASGKPRVLYLGGASELKGYDVASQFADTLAGPGILELRPEEVAQAIAEHDVVLVPTSAEAFGLVAAEAIGSGRWVVARDVGGLRQIIQPSVNGTLVADEDWAGALAGVPDYDPYAVAATVQSFSLRGWQSRMAAAWNQLLAERSGGSPRS